MRALILGLAGSAAALNMPPPGRECFQALGKACRSEERDPVACKACEDKNADALKAANCTDTELSEFCTPRPVPPAPPGETCLRELGRVCGRDRFNQSACEKCEADNAAALQKSNCTDDDKTKYCNRPAPPPGYRTCYRELEKACEKDRHDKTACQACEATNADALKEANCTQDEEDQFCGGRLTEAYVRANAPAMFSEFKDTHGRKYASPEEEASRLAIFTNTMLEAARSNLRSPLATFGPTRFSDLTDEEMQAYYGDDSVETPSPPDVFSAEEVTRALAASFDWRDKNVVTQVKDQGHCGSCWTFSTTGSIEGQWAMKGNKLTSLSEQQLVSCDAKKCAGGSVGGGVSWFVKNTQGKVATDASFPYTSGTGKTEACKKSLTTGATVKGSTSLPHDEKQMLTWASKNGPLSISVDAGPFKSYKSGIMTGHTINSGHNHAILIVGYGTEGSTPYWIVKNSWGTSFGEKGYIRMEFGTNQCDIKVNPVYVTV